MAKDEQQEEQQEVEAPEETQTKVERPKQNDVTRPGPGTATGRVWEIADELSADIGEPAVRGDVLKVAESEGLNPATAATQYGRWRKFHGLGRYSNTKTTEKIEAEGEVADAPEVEEEE